MLQEAIGQVLSFGVVVGLSPIPIIGVVVMLGTPRARVNGPAFLVGWVVGLSVVGVAVLLIAKGAGAADDGGTASGDSWLKIALGVLLIVLAAKQWRGRPRDGAPGNLPAWLQAVDRFGAAKAAGMGVVLSAANPKNLIMTVGASVAIVQTGAPVGDKFVALAVFVAIGTVGVAAPVVAFFVLGERATRMLDDMKAWLAAHNNAVMAVLLLVIGAKLLGDGIAIA